AETALQIVKQLARRYLGYLGVAIATYNFTKCMMIPSPELSDSFLRDFSKYHSMGVYPHPYDRRKFIETDGESTAVVEECPFGTEFDPKEKRCDWPFARNH
ncbi:MAG: carbohydrate-binding module family 14 protein, partial [Polaribacter sp.]